MEVDGRLYLSVIVMTFWYIFGTDFTFFELFERLLFFTWD